MNEEIERSCQIAGEGKLDEDEILKFIKDFEKKDNLSLDEFKL